MAMAIYDSGRKVFSISLNHIHLSRNVIRKIFSDCLDPSFLDENIMVAKYAVAFAGPEVKVLKQNDLWGSDWAI